MSNTTIRVLSPPLESDTDDFCAFTPFSDQEHRVLWTPKERETLLLPAALDLDGDFQLTFSHAPPEPAQVTGPGSAVGRGIACMSYQGRFLSLTMRTAVPISSPDSPTRSLPDEQDSGFAPPKWKPPYLTPISLLADQLSDLVLAPSTHGHRSWPIGLLAITGSTKSAKSLIARALIHRLICDRRHEYQSGASRRRPHLLTLEDPVERWWFSSNLDPVDPWITQAWGLDYTPRWIGRDTVSLYQGLQSALRQTPSVVYVGEVRKSEDWREVVDFAATGHLVVTTAHAGSLQEAMARIFEAVGVKSPAERGQVARRILGLVHIRNYEESALERHWEAKIPSVWRHTPASVARLVTDGLSSLIPSDSADASVIGRRWFARTLIERAQSLCQDGFEHMGEVLTEIAQARRLSRTTLSWDLRGE